MSAPLILGTNSIKDVGYNVDNSLRMSADSNDSLSRTLGSGNQKTFTISLWFKPSKISFTDSGTGTDRQIIGQTASSYWRILLYRDFTMQIYGETTFNFKTNQLFRDFSAWYNLVVKVDTTQSTESNRVKIYINGSQVTSFSSATYPTQNQDLAFNNAQLHSIGRSSSFGGYDYYDGYLAEVVLIDGTALDADQFGEFDSDTGIWKPIDVSGLTFGTNGFYLDFEDSSALGNDVSGNNNDFTVNNLTSIDQTTDTCTNNYVTWNPLDAYYYNGTFSEGNLQTTTATSQYGYLPANIGISSGKWYCEIEWDSKSGGGGAGGIGITSTQASSTTNQLGNNANDYRWYAPDGKVYNNSSAIVTLNTFTTGDIIGIYLDLDNNKLYFAKNGTIENSGTGISITDPASTPLGFYFFAIDYPSTSYTGTYKANFGNPITTISSGNSDPNGYGNFEYSPNDGGSASFDSTAKDFYALNTKNLAEYG